MKSTPNHTDQRGQILIYAMLTMSAMLAIGLTLSSLFIARIRNAGAARDTTVAIYVADSAVEKCLYEARTEIPVSAIVFNPELAGATYTITNAATNVDITNDCTVLGSGSFGFRASGKYRGVTRTLEISQ